MLEAAAALCTNCGHDNRSGRTPPLAAPTLRIPMCLRSCDGLGELSREEKGGIRYSSKVISKSG